MDGCEDIDRFAALAEWFTEFHVQYLSKAGAIRLYYPDFVAVQVTKDGSTYWIIETKGQEFEDTDTKAAHMHRWCEEVSRETGECWYYLKVPQVTFGQFIKGAAVRRFNGLIEWEERQRKFAV